jgi:hypothetical protein
VLQGLVSGKTIAVLNNFAFRRVMNTLLTVEAENNGVPLSDVDISTRDNDPDQGVDAFVVWPTHSTHEFYRGGRTVVQYKSGKLSETSIWCEAGHKIRLPRCVVGPRICLMVWNKS